MTRTGPCLTHTLSQHGAPSLDMEATSWVKDSSLNDCSILYYNQQCTRYYFGSSPQLSFVQPGRLVLGSIPSLQDMRRCQIKVQFESGVKTKFLAPIFQSMTSISDYQSIPRSHSFQNMYNTYMCKMHLKGEK